MQSPLSIQQVLARPKNRELVEQLLGKDAAWSLTGLAKELCRRLDLRDFKGNDRLSTTRRALRDLEAQGYWTLPRSTAPARPGWIPIRLKKAVKAATGVPESAEEVTKHPPTGATAVRWLLLTTLPVVSVKQALKSIKWYCRRWRIEEWHRVLKSGCKILAHQNHRAEVLLRAIALDAVIAWRIMLLALLGREVPELPSDVHFDPCECEVLELLAKKKISVGEAMIAIAQLGGYLHRKCDGPLGFESLWRGYARFHDMVYILRRRNAAEVKRQ